MHEVAWAREMEMEEVLDQEAGSQELLALPAAAAAAAHAHVTVLLMLM